MMPLVEEGDEVALFFQLVVVYYTLLNVYI